MNHRIGRKALILLALSLTVGTTLSASAKIVDGIAARVNDEIITYYDVKKAVTPYLMQNGMKPAALDDPETRRTVYDNVLTRLIEEKLILQEAEQLNLSVSDQKVDKWIRRMQKRQGISPNRFRQLIQQRGMDFEAYRDRIRQNLLKMKVVRVKLGSKISIPDNRVDEVYEQKYGDEGEKQKHITVRHILIQPSEETEAGWKKAKRKANKLRARIENGESLADLAREHSDGPNAKKGGGGRLGTFKRGELNPEFEEAAFQLEEGEISDVVRTKFGYHIIKVTDISKQAGPKAQQRKSKIRGKLRRKARKEQMEKYVARLKKNAYVERKWEFSEQ